MTLFVAASAFGRGVYSDQRIAAGVEIERASVIVVPADEVAALGQTPLADYWYAWGEDDSEAAIALGFGALYNHSDRANAAFENFEDEGVISYVAVRDIGPGEEITVDYTTGEPDRYPIWFPYESRPSTAKREDALAIGPAIRVTDRGADRAVIATRSFRAQDTIERAPAIVIPRAARAALDRTVLAAACLAMDPEGGGCVLGLGAVPLYRRAAGATARLTVNAAASVVDVVALRSLAVGEEITLGSPPSRTRQFLI